MTGRILQGDTPLDLIESRPATSKASLPKVRPDRPRADSGNGVGSAFCSAAIPTSLRGKNAPVAMADQRGPSAEVDTVVHVLGDRR